MPEALGFCHDERNASLNGPRLGIEQPIGELVQLALREQAKLRMTVRHRRSWHASPFRSEWSRAAEQAQRAWLPASPGTDTPSHPAPGLSFSQSRDPVQYPPMFAVRPFLLNTASAALAGVAARASITKTTTIKG